LDGTMIAHIYCTVFYCLPGVEKDRGAAADQAEGQKRCAGKGTRRWR